MVKEKQREGERGSQGELCGDWFSQTTEDWQLKSKPHGTIWLYRSLHLFCSRLSVSVSLSLTSLLSLVVLFSPSLPSPILAWNSTQWPYGVDSKSINHLLMTRRKGGKLWSKSPPICVCVFFYLLSRVTPTRAGQLSLWVIRAVLSYLHIKWHRKVAGHSFDNINTQKLWNVISVNFVTLSSWWVKEPKGFRLLWMQYWLIALQEKALCSALKISNVFFQWMGMFG